MRAAALLALAAGCGAPDAGAAPALDPRPETSRFGVDYVFPLDPYYRDPALARTLAATGAGWVNFHEVSWAQTEPHAPRGGVHAYRWEALDEAVRIWERAGFRIVFTLRLQDGWFAGPPHHQMPFPMPLAFFFERNADRLPRDLEDYRAWIRSLVERYDGDGVDDLPGLRHPVRHFQIGNEYANPMFWLGAEDEYATLLRAARAAARAASPDAVVISQGIRWNDLFEGDPGGEHFEEVFGGFLATLPDDAHRQEWRRARRITEATVALAGEWDVLDAGGNGPYAGASSGYMAWVRAEMAKGRLQAEIWDAEARCEPQIAVVPYGSYHPELEVPGGQQILAGLRRGDPAVVRWYRAEQARVLAQVFVARFAAGFEKVFLGMATDWDHSLGALSTPNPFLGLVDRGGHAWPALYALRDLRAALDGFATAERVEAGSGVFLARFTFAGGRAPVWVAWLEEERVRGLDDPLPARPVRLPGVTGVQRVRAVPTTSDRAEEVPFEAGTAWLGLTLGPTPVIVEQERPPGGT